MSWRTSLILAIVLIPVGVVAGCSVELHKPAPAQLGSAGQPNAVGGGSNQGDAVADAGGDSTVDSEGGVCNSVTESGNTIDRTGVVGDPPTALGGTIADGTYDLTDDSVYVGTSGVAGPTGITNKATLVIAGTSWNEAIDTGGTGKTVTSSQTTSIVTATGATLAMAQTCPSSSGQQLQYTVNNTSLVLIDPVAKEAFTFTMH